MSLKIELQRKAIHLTTSLVPLGYAFWGSRQTAAIVLAALSVGMLAVEAVRHGDHGLGRTFRRWFEFMLREEELTGGRGDGQARRKPKWLGATPYCLASLGCVLTFPKPIAVLALLYLALGDTAASLVGKQWGRIRIGKKSLEGLIAFVVSTALVAVIAHSIDGQYPLIGGIVAAAVAGLAELFLVRIDDNLSIPVAAGVTMWLLQGI